MKNRLFTTIFLSFIAFLLFGIVNSVNAQITCQPIYGGGQTCTSTGNVVIDKKVINPSTNAFVDNLSASDPTFGPSDTVNFRLNVTNNGSENVQSIEIKDVFPQYIDFQSGDGNYDSSTKTLIITLANLAPKETRTFEFAGKVIDTNQIPDSQNVVCVINQASATANNESTSQDNAQFCIQRSFTPTTTRAGFPISTPTQAPTPITTTPSTGPESLALFSMIPIGGAGLLFRRLSDKNKEAKN